MTEEDRKACDGVRLLPEEFLLVVGPAGHRQPLAILHSESVALRIVRGWQGHGPTLYRFRAGVYHEVDAQVGSKEVTL